MSTTSGSNPYQRCNVPSYTLTLNYFEQVDLEKTSCAEPCTQMSMTTILLKHNAGDYGVNWASFVFSDTVLINTDTNNYDIFSLFVEAGSSLGLWVGLCAVGVYDLFFDWGSSLAWKMVKRCNVSS